MRILFLSSVFPHPEAPTRGIYSLQLCKALTARHQVQVVAPRSWVDVSRGLLAGKRGKVEDATATANGLEVEYPCYYYPPKVLRGLHASLMWASVRRRVRRLAARFQPDCVVSYWAYPDGAAALRAARHLGVPGMVMVGGSDVLLLTQQAAWRRRILDVLHDADAVITVGQDLKTRLVELGIAPEKVHLVPRGVDTELFKPGDRTLARRRLQIPENARVLLWVGRMVEIKGLDVLLAAAERLYQHQLDLRIYLVGEGPLRSALERACKERQLNGAVSFVGPVLPEDLPDWYRAADYTVLPSRSEGVPNVLRESLACGTPFVASRVGGIPELARDPANRLVTPNDPKSLADALAEVLQRPQPLQSLYAQQALGWKDSAEALASVLEPLVAGRHSTPAKTRIAPWSVRQVLRRALEAVLPRRRLLVRGPASSGSVCLTFDDGPDPEHTPRLLDVLKREGVPATFFLIGQKVERHPEIVRRIVQEGHAVGHHSFYHTDPQQTSAPQLRAEVQRTRELLAGLLGQPPDLFRPPHGKLTPAKLWQLWRAGQTVVLWNVDPKDWACQEADEVRAWFQRHAFRGGDIVLMHDDHPHAAEVVPELSRRVRAKGLDFKTLPQWLG